MIDTSQFARDGYYLMLALDHRGSFEKFADTKDTATLVALKKQIIASSYDLCTGVLIDPDYGLPAYQEFVASVGGTPKPMLLCIEQSGYTDDDNERITILQYSAAELRGMGAAGVKLLVYFNPEAQNAETQLATAKDVLVQCQSEGLPLFLEIVTYEIPGHVFDKTRLVPASVRYFLEHGVHADVFKLEYPGDESTCMRTSQMLGDTPWIMLSQGDEFSVFCDHLRQGGAGGVKGFLAGRSLWKEFKDYQGPEREKFFASTVRDRFAQIIAAVHPGS